MMPVIRIVRIGLSALTRARLLLLSRLFAGVLRRLMMTDPTAGGGARCPMMSCEMSDDAADGRPLQTPGRM